MKKICKSCGRNRRIGRFGKVVSNPDGKNGYCRQCMMEIRRSYECTPKGNIKRKRDSKKWRNNHKDHIKEYNEKYYQRHRNRILFNLCSKRSTECILIPENTRKNINRNRLIHLNPQEVKYGD